MQSRFLKHGIVAVQVPYLGDDAPAGLLRGFLGDALEAGKLRFRAFFRVQTDDAAFAVEKCDVMGAQLCAFCTT